MDEAGLRDEEINIRMTGCPNGCARPALGEIAFIGKSPASTICIWVPASGRPAEQAVPGKHRRGRNCRTLKPIMHRYAKERNEGEHFGDFVVRNGYVKATTSGLNFHD